MRKPAFNRWVSIGPSNLSDPFRETLLKARAIGLAPHSGGKHDFCCHWFFRFSGTAAQRRELERWWDEMHVEWTARKPRTAPFGFDERAPAMDWSECAWIDEVRATT